LRADRRAWGSVRGALWQKMGEHRLKREGIDRSSSKMVCTCKQGCRETERNTVCGGGEANCEGREPQKKVHGESRIKRPTNKRVGENALHSKAGKEGPCARRREKRGLNGKTSGSSESVRRND